MGGIGSGRWYRWDTRTTTEQLHHVDIRYLKKRGFLKPNTFGTLSWNCRGEQTGSIKFKTTRDSLQLIYRQRNNGGDWIDKNERIVFDWTHCNYGGSRQWFLCPHCGKRVAILYGLNSGFLCRHCYRLPYASQSETYLDRMFRKVRKIRKKLDGDIDLDIPLYRKPKGMHWKTFNNYVEVERKTNLRVSTEFEKVLMSLKGL